MKHAPINELLALAEGEASAGVAEHVAGCEHCQAEAEHLKQVAMAMSRLPLEQPDHDLWPEVLAAIEQEDGTAEAPRPPRRLGAALASSSRMRLLAASLLMAAAVASLSIGALRSNGDRGTDQQPGFGSEISDRGARVTDGSMNGQDLPARRSTRPGGSGQPAELASLVQASRELETILRTPSLRFTVLSPKEAAIIVALEDRIAVVDSQLQRRSLMPSGQAAEADAEAAELWLDRVELLHALVRLHGAAPALDAADAPGPGQPAAEAYGPARDNRTSSQETRRYR